MDYDFEASVGYWTNVTAQAFRRALNEELAPHGITFRQAQALAWLVLEGDLSQSELAVRMEIEPPTLAGIIDRMEAAGWVRRMACADDRRKKLVRIEVEAEPVWEKFTDCARRVRAQATAGLSDREVEQLRSLLQTVHDNLTQKTALAATS